MWHLAMAPKVAAYLYHPPGVTQTHYSRVSAVAHHHVCYMLRFAICYLAYLLTNKVIN